MTRRHIAAALATFAACTLAATAMAASDFTGFYLGAAGTYNASHLKNSNLVINSSSKIDNTRFGGRMYFGYQFTPYCALEAGYANLGKIDIDNINGGTTNGRLSQTALDITARAIWPFSFGLYVYAKGGAAELTNEGERGLEALASHYGITRRKWHALYGAGLGYKLTDTLAIEMSATRIQKRHEIPSIESYAAGLEYHFG